MTHAIAPRPLLDSVRDVPEEDVVRQEPDAILESARDAAAVAGAAAAKVDEAAAWPEAGIEALLRAGLGGLVVPLRLGGLGFGLDVLARVGEILGGACASTSMCFGMHGVASAVLAAKATDDQRRRFLDPIVAGEHLTSLALSEPGTGSHFWIPETTAVPDGDHLVLTGKKSFVTNGGRADSYVVNVASPDAESLGEFSCLVLEADRPGMTWGKPWTGIGMRGNSSRDITFDQVPVPARNLLGKPGDEIWYVFSVIAPYFLAAMAGTYLGIASAALDRAIGWIRERDLADTGRSIAALDVAQHHIGELWAQVERTRALLRSACAMGDVDAPNALPALSSAKAEVAVCVNDVVGGAMALMGGSAIRDGGPMGRHLRDARAAHVMSPTTDLLRLWTGRSLLGRPLLV